MTQPLLAVSMGDPCGIGPDILLNTWQNRTELDIPDLIVTGNTKFLKQRANAIGATVDMHKLASPVDIQPDKLCILDVDGEVTGKPGKPAIGDARATITAIDRAVELVFEETCSAIVTCPINKDALYQAGFNHPGHTEYLGELARRHTGKSHTPVMMIAVPDLRTVPVTIHIPLSEVPDQLSAKQIIQTIEITRHDLKYRFGIAKPRIAVAGLNPHAGENGSLGKEELTTITPALETLRAKGIEVSGPLPADTMFHASARAKYDVAVCMYHDQALIPAKMIGFDKGVNATLGLPFIRTSPDHGTAYDIAGTGKAEISSFVAALKMAATMATAS